LLSRFIFSIPLLTGVGERAECAALPGGGGGPRGRIVRLGEASIFEKLGDLFGSFGDGRPR